MAQRLSTNGEGPVTGLKFPRCSHAQGHPTCIWGPRKTRSALLDNRKALHKYHATHAMQPARWRGVSCYPCAARYCIAPRWNQTRGTDTLCWPPDGQTQPTCALLLQLYWQHCVAQVSWLSIRLGNHLGCMITIRSTYRPCSSRATHMCESLRLRSIWETQASLKNSSWSISFRLCLCESIKGENNEKVTTWQL